jgi:hypothetical protein
MYVFIFSLGNNVEIGFAFNIVEARYILYYSIIFFDSYQIMVASITTKGEKKECVVATTIISCEEKSPLENNRLGTTQA